MKKLKKPTRSQYDKIKNYFFRNDTYKMISFEEFQELISPIANDENFCILEPMDDGQDIYLNWIYIDGGNRGVGEGKKLYKKLVNWAKKEGYTTIYFHIRWTNSPSLVAAVKSGAKIVGYTMFDDGENGYELAFKF